jgi:hypothetical protein
MFEYKIKEKIISKPSGKYEFEIYFSTILLNLR